MKKFIICLLLICIIVLGCVGLTACDKDTYPNAEPQNNIEITEKQDGIFNFKIWYSKDFYNVGLFIPIIKCTSQLLGGGPPFLDTEPGATIIVYPNTTSADNKYDAQFLLNKDTASYSIIPNTWISFDLQLLVSNIATGGWDYVPEEYQEYFPSPIFTIELFSESDYDFQSPMFTKIIDFSTTAIKSAQ